ncbi:MAG TPA: alkaline phosphatase family protein [Myxococcales bacterium]|nr:alkaline phosphatase family protein [Myxococcales bacterium]
MREPRSRLVQGLVKRVLRPVAKKGRMACSQPLSGRRLLLLHLDGVGHKQLVHAMANGLAPNIQKLLRDGTSKLSSCRAGAPTSTPAFQAGLLYGSTDQVPGYTWFEKKLGREMRMDRAADARLLEAELAAAGEPLLERGTVYCSIFSGGARPRRWALSGWNESLTGKSLGLANVHDALAATLVHSATASRIAGALGLDFASGLIETARWVRGVGSMQHEPQFLFHRVLTECLFAEFTANSCVIDIARGTPIVYGCFIGYDEYAHRRGPYSHLAMLKLFELDRMLGRIIAAARALPELKYELYLFSDHGQAATVPAEQVLGESLGEHLLADGATAGSRAVAFGAAGGGETAATAARARWLRRMSGVLPGVLATSALAWARHNSHALDAGQPGFARGPLLVVPSGDIAHLYSTETKAPIHEAELRARHPCLLERCANSPAIGFTLVRGDRGPIALRGSLRMLIDKPEGAVELNRIVGHPLAATYARDLLRIERAGDVILLGTAAEGANGRGAVAFPWEFGSHGGLAPEQLDIFMVHPASLGDEAFADVVRPADLHRFFLTRSGRAQVSEHAA